MDGETINQLVFMFFLYHYASLVFVSLFSFSGFDRIYYLGEETEVDATPAVLFGTSPEQPPSLDSTPKKTV